MTKEPDVGDPSTAHMIRMEKGQSVVRVTICVVLAIYFALLYAMEPPSDPYRETIRAFSLVLAGGFFYTVVFVVWSYYIPNQAWIRRYFTPLLDIVPASGILAIGGEPVMPIAALYLTVTIGNGLRFGVRFLWLGAIISLIGFATTVVVSPVWHGHPFFAACIGLTLILVPPYVAHLIGRLHRSMAEAAEANRAKSEFLARMSHELRTPLHAIVSTTELLDADRLPRDQRDILGVLRDSIDTLLRQVNQVLDLSKIEAGKIELVRAPFNLHDTLTHLLALFEPSAAQQGLTLALDLAPDVPLALTGDAKLLGDVLQNLVGNAIKFTPRGDVKVSVRMLDADGERTWLRFEVSDTGIGISTEFLPKLFDRFVQEDGTITRRYGGSGLGMTISKQLVERMGGRILVQSGKGIGTTVTVEIPFDVEGDRHIERETPGQTDAVPAAPTGRRLLAADDNAINRLLLDRMLSGAGYHITLCIDGNQARDRLEHEHFDLAIIDVHMPGKGGLDVARELRAAGNTTPLLVLTADVTAETRRHCAALALPYLAKPVRRNTLIATIEAVLSHQAPPTAAGDPPAIGQGLFERAQFEELAGTTLESPAGRDVARRFLQDIDEQQQALAEAAKAGNWAELRERLHTAKGVASMFGATALARVFEFHEKRGDDTLQQQTKRMFREIADTVAETAVYLGRAEVERTRQPRKAPPRTKRKA
jgi:two-component system, sensor histidine kinase RpfC